MSTNNNQENVNNLLNSLSKFSIRLILIVSIIMCIGVVAMDSIHIVSNEDADEQMMVVKDYTDEKMDVFEGFVFQYEKIIKEYVSLVENGLDSNNDNEYTSIYSILEEGSGENKAILNFYLGLESKEMLLMPKQELPDGYDPTSRPWYTDAVENGIGWTPMYNDASTGEFVISLSAPVMSQKTGELLGVLSLDIQANELLESVQNWQVTETGYFAIIDDGNIVLNHPDTNLIGLEVPIVEISNLIGSVSNGTIVYEWQGEERVAYIFNFEPLGLNILHLDEALRNKWLPINYGFIAIFIIGTILMLFLVLNKINWAKKQIINSDMYHEHSYDIESKSVNQTKLKQISEELRMAASKLDELS